MRWTVLFNENIHDYVMYLIKNLEPTIDKYMIQKHIIPNNLQKLYILFLNGTSHCDEHTQGVRIIAVWWLLSSQLPYLHQKGMSNVNIFPANQVTYINRYKNPKRKVLLSNTESNNNSRRSHWLKPMWLTAIILTPCVNTLDVTTENAKLETTYLTELDRI